MRHLFLGDIVGRAGREAVLHYLPELRATLDPDSIIVNGENAAHGFGLNESIANTLFLAGVDCITTGNHVWDKREIIPVIERDPRILRPLNFPGGTSGQGASVIEGKHGARILIINVMARLFMEPLDDPFAAIETVLQEHQLGNMVEAIIVDFHGEASSEKMALAHFCDGRASLVVGTHTHIPTADAQILPGGTAYQTDAGMCGDYDSVIGMQKEPSVRRYRTKMPMERMAPAEGPGTVCGVYIETSDQSGLATRIEPVRLGARLANCMPVR